MRKASTAIFFFLIKNVLFDGVIRIRFRCCIASINSIMSVEGPDKDSKRYVCVRVFVLHACLCCVRGSSRVCGCVIITLPDLSYHQ